jgi:hypothetical protein
MMLWERIQPFSKILRNYFLVKIGAQSIVNVLPYNYIIWNAQRLPEWRRRMEFTEYLRNKHQLKKGERKLREISVGQYENRLINMEREGIYRGEQVIDDELETRLLKRYKDWKTYRRTIRFFIDSEGY